MLQALAFSSSCGEYSAWTSHEPTSTYPFAQVTFLPNQSTRCKGRSSLPGNKDPECQRQGPRQRREWVWVKVPTVFSIKAAGCPASATRCAFKLWITVWRVPGHPWTKQAVIPNFPSIPKPQGDTFKYWTVLASNTSANLPWFVSWQWLTFGKHSLEMAWNSWTLLCIITLRAFLLFNKHCCPPRGRSCWIARRYNANWTRQDLLS